MTRPLPPPDTRTLIADMPVFEIAHDPLRPLIRVRMTGLWTVEMVDTFAAAMDRAVEEQARRTATFAILIDRRTCPVQPAQVSARFQAFVYHRPPPGQGPVQAIALVVGSMLDKLQVQRTLGDFVTIFTDPDMASDWLTGRTAAGSAGALPGGR